MNINMKCFLTRVFSSNKRKGAILIMLVSMISAASFTLALFFINERTEEFKIARATADGFKAYLLARAGLQGAIGALKKIPEEVLYQSGIAFNPPPVEFVKGGTTYYRISSEDGKFNLNDLVRAYDGSPNLKMQEMFTRLFEQLGIQRTKIYPIIDWIDENNDEAGGGGEMFYYNNLKPPRKIKNGMMYSLSELASVKDWNSKLIYESLKNPEKEKETSKDFLSEEEKLLISDADYVLSYNITAYVPHKDTGDERINLNAAPYHVLMSLSEYMTRAAAMKILKLKTQKGGYIKELSDLKNEPEFLVKTAALSSKSNQPQGQNQTSLPNQPAKQTVQQQPQSITLYDEIAGDGTAVFAAKVKTQGEIYKIVGVGVVNSATRKVTCIFDRTNDQILFYSED
jgi:general secretion pathway protein K